MPRPGLFLTRLGHGLGQLQMNCKFCKITSFFWGPLEAKSEEKPSNFLRNQTILWLRGQALNLRPPGYELPSVPPSAAAQCFLGLWGLKWPRIRGLYLFAPREF